MTVIQKCASSVQYFFFVFFSKLDLVNLSLFTITQETFAQELMKPDELLITQERAMRVTYVKYGFGLLGIFS